MINQFPLERKFMRSFPECRLEGSESRDSEHMMCLKQWFSPWCASESPGGLVKIISDSVGVEFAFRTSSQMALMLLVGDRSLKACSHIYPYRIWELLQWTFPARYVSPAANTPPKERSKREGQGSAWSQATLQPFRPPLERTGLFWKELVSQHDPEKSSLRLNIQFQISLDLRTTVQQLLL